MSALAAALRAAGLTVTEHRRPGRPQSWAPTHVMLHHTAGAATGDAPSLNFVINGSASLPGPLYQMLVARSGMLHLITEGRANHAGTGSGLVPHGVPADMGNARCWGIGVESPGRSQDWTPAQWNACHIAARVLLQRMGTNSSRLWRHLDYTTRKIDTLYPLAQHRAAVDSGGAPPPPPPAPPPPPPGTFVPVFRQNRDVWSNKMRLNQSNSNSVWNLQSALLAAGFSIPDGPTMFYGQQTKAAVAAYQRSQGWTGNDASGIAGRTSVTRLGLNWRQG